MLPLLRLVATLVVIHHGAQHIQVLRGATISRSKWSNPYRWTCPGNITSKTEIDMDRCGLYWFITICNTTVRLISPIVFWGYEATLGCLGCPPKHKTGKHYDKLHNMYNIMIVYIYNFDIYNHNIYIHILVECWSLANEGFTSGYRETPVPGNKKIHPVSWLRLWHGICPFFSSWNLDIRLEIMGCILINMYHLWEWMYPYYSNGWIVLLWLVFVNPEMMIILQ